MSGRRRHEPDDGGFSRLGKVVLRAPVGDPAEVDRSRREDRPEVGLGGAGRTAAAQAVGAHRHRQRAFDAGAALSFRDEGRILGGGPARDEGSCSSRRRGAKARGRASPLPPTYAPLRDTIPTDAPRPEIVRCQAEPQGFTKRSSMRSLSPIAA